MINRDKVFVSYSSTNEKFAARLVEDLETNGINVFSYSAKIPHGNDFQYEIDKAISNSTKFIPIFSPDYFGSTWCQVELHAWVNKRGDEENTPVETCQIFPIYYKKCVIPPTASIYTYISISEENYQEGFKKLFSSITGKLNEPLLFSDTPFIYNYPWNGGENESNNPYRLRTFGPLDEDLFDRRGIFLSTRELILTDINEGKSNCITVEGESGSGKSSLVLAGLVPKLAKENCWKFVYVELDEDPFKDLASALISINERIFPYDKPPLDKVEILTQKIKESENELKHHLQKIKDHSPKKKILFIVDQLDSLYTKGITNQDRKKFLSLLKNCFPKEQDNTIFLIATFDSSVINKVDQDYKEFLGKNVRKIPILEHYDLLRLIKEPAGSKGVEFSDDNLPLQIIEELGDQKNLYILGVTLESLWDKYEELINNRAIIEQQITRHIYDTSGKVEKALDLQAQKIIDPLKAEDQEKAKQLFLRMVREVDDDKRIVTRRISVASKDYSRLVNNLKKLVKATTNPEESGTIEIEFIHAKLAGKWSKLKDWIGKTEDFNDARALEKHVNTYKEYLDSKWRYLIHWHFLFTGRSFIRNRTIFHKYSYLFENPRHIENFFIKSLLTGAVFALILVLSFSIAVYFFSSPQNEDSEIEKIKSLGEKPLFSSLNSNKNNAIEYFRNGIYSAAIVNFEKALMDNKNDPESLIYKNNAKINELMELDLGIKPVLMATSLPKKTNRIVALEMLRGVAHAQNDIMKDFEGNCLDIDEKGKKKYKTGCSNGIKGKPLQIMIIDDGNEKEFAVKIAKYLLKNEKVLAVVGHNASEVSSEAAKEYQKGKLVMMTPTSFAIKFRNLSDLTPAPKTENYIYAVAYSHEVLARKIVDEMKLQLKPATPKVLLCYDGSSFDQDAFKESFEKIAKNEEIELALIKKKNESPQIRNNGNKDAYENCDFTKDDLNLVYILEEAKKMHVNAIFMASHVNKIGDSISVLKNIKREFDETKIKIFSSPTLYTNQTIELGGKNVAGLSMAVGWFPQENPKEGSFEINAINLWTDNTKICGQYKESSQEGRAADNCKDPLAILDEIGITWRSAMAYDTTHILKKALDRSEKISRKSLQKSISSEDFSYKGVTGVVEFYSYSKCSTEKNNIQQLVDCFPGKRMVTDSNPGSLAIIKIQEYSPPPEFKLFRFGK